MKKTVVILLALFFLCISNIFANNYHIEKFCEGRDPEINNHGDLAFNRKGQKINDYLYYLAAMSYIDSTGTFKLLSSPTSSGLGPHLNDNREFVWNENGIKYYNGITKTTIPGTDSYYSNPIINNNRRIVMGNGGRNMEELYVYDFNISLMTQLTNNSLADYMPMINNNNDIVWAYGYDGSATPEFEIMHYTDKTQSITQLTSNSYDDYSPRINDKGDIVWYGFDGEDWEIFYYSQEDDTITQLTDNSIYDGRPDINNNGDIVWTESVTGETQEIFRYAASTGLTEQITSGSLADMTSRPRINDYGDIVWSIYDTDDEKNYIYKAKAMNSIPEPTTLILFGLGLFGILTRRKHKII